MPDLLPPQNAAQRAAWVLSLLFRGDGRRLKESHVKQVLRAFWFNRHNTPLDAEVSSEAQATCLLETLALAVKQDYRNAACREAAAQAAQAAASAIDRTDLSEDEPLLQEESPNG